VGGLCPRDWPALGNGWVIYLVIGYEPSFSKSNRFAPIQYFENLFSTIVHDDMTDNSTERIFKILGWCKVVIGYLGDCSWTFVMDDDCDGFFCVPRTKNN
jgi:hypothetical protein